MHTIKLALDWTPNVNHIGFFVAKALGLYEQRDIKLELINPLEDNYALTPGKKLEMGKVDFAIAPFESVISYNNKTNKINAVAVFAILQNDLSSIATLRNSGINSPKQLDGQVYASYKARYEDHIVQQMIKNDGGKGDIKINYPEKLGIWNTLLEGKADATWIFDNWEGVEAESKNLNLTKFRMEDYGIPYAYSPILLTKKENINKHKDAYAKFIKASKEGFLYAAKNQPKSAEISQKHLTEYDQKNIDLEKSLAVTASHFGNKETCGWMEPERINSFLEWIVRHQLENKGILQQELFTNQLLE